MFLSIIIPVYNAEAYLEECLDSCLKQDIAESDYEIICINDGSTDGSAQILKRYSEEHSNVCIIFQSNQGVSAARNAGLDIAKGDYIWFVDSDDFVRENVLAQMRERCSETACDRLLFQAYLVNEQLTEQEKLLIREKKLKSNTPSSGICCSLFLRDHIDKDGLRFHAELCYGEDTVFVCRFREMAKETVLLQKPLYYYRQHKASAMHDRSAKGRERRLKSHVSCAIYTRRMYDSEQIKLEGTANDLLWFVRVSMIDVAKHYDDIARDALKTLKNEKLFPMKRLPEATLKKAYSTTRTDAIGRLYNWLCMQSHTRTGFFLLRVWYCMYHCIKRA